ncbi:MAG: hypothetical protein HKN16_12585 [Saprospiraceae bacterium]|nr:hypothetical protein [Saprospiraceae bacterium]
MRLTKITAHQKAKAIEVLAHGFRENKNLLWITRFRSEKCIQRLCAYCLEVSLIKKGAFITEDGFGVILIYQSSRDLSVRQKILLGFHFCKLILTTVNLIRLNEIFSFTREVNQKRPGKNHLYCWMIATDPKRNSLKTVFALKQFAVQMAKIKGLPLYLQTSMLRLKRAYERAGFVAYDKIYNVSGNYHLWFLKREPIQS